MNYGEFNPQLPLDEAKTPPSSWYFSPRFFIEERERVFKRDWVYIGRKDQLQKSGDYFTLLFMGEPYFFLHHEEGLQGFANSCRHHAALLLDGEGHLEENRKIVCPYHGWNYDFKGKLIKAPHAGKMRNFCRDKFSLPSFPVQSIGPFLFSYLGDHSAKDHRTIYDHPLSTLSSFLQEKKCFDLQFYSRRVYTLSCNWKIFVDNYLDGGLHVPYAHHNLSTHLDLSQYSTQIFPRSSIQSCLGGEQGKGQGQGQEHTDERIGKEAHYLWIYPNFMINRYGDLMDTNWVVPLSAKKTLVIFDYFYDPDSSLSHDRQFTTKMERFIQESDQVQQEDIELCRKVQTGLQSSTYSIGRYVPGFEGPMYRFHQELFQDLTSTGRAME